MLFFLHPGIKFYRSAFKNMENESLQIDKLIKSRDWYQKGLNVAERLREDLDLDFPILQKLLNCL